MVGGKLLSVWDGEWHFEGIQAPWAPTLNIYTYIYIDEHIWSEQDKVIT